MVKIIFWNCGLCPLPNSEFNKENLKFLTECILTFRYELMGDIIIITEVNNKIVAALKETLKGETVTDLTGRAAANSKFDFVAITSKDITISNISYIKTNSTTIEEEKIEVDENHTPNRGRTLKVGVLLEIEHKDCIDNFTIISSHWSSQKEGFNEQNRRESAEKLKRLMKSKSKEKKQTILLGDYNDSPTSTPILHKLEATSNRHYASLDKSRIYNASSSFSLPHIPYIIGESRHFHGTWLSKNRATRRNFEKACMVFDQIMCASSFISAGPWHLNENETKVVYGGNMLELLYNGNSDHFPITTKIEYQPRLQVKYE